jgi:galactokinase
VFVKTFETSQNPLIVQSPGHLKIIGEHTDDSGGFVLPAEINKAAYLAIALRDVSEVMLNDYLLPKSLLIIQRSRFIVQEIDCLQKGCEDLKIGEINALGKKCLQYIMA